MKKTKEQSVSARRTWRLVAGGVVVAVATTGVLLVRSLRVSQFPNIILISIDTCRADHWGCYGSKQDLTPNIDALARQATVFMDVTSPCPLTLPAHTSMFTGKIPPCHGVHDNIYHKVPDSEVTLAERLKEHGYSTAAFVGAFVLDKKFGLSQGFDHYDDELNEELTIMAGYAERRGEEVTRAATAWLDEHAGERFFLFAHYYDPHHPYRPPAPFDTRYAENLYAGEIAYVDQQIGRLVSHLKGLGLFESSLIIVTADHGEALGEHGEEFHGFFIYRSTTRVPLLIKNVGQSQAWVSSAKAGLIDIVPTILAQLSLEVPPDMSGEDLSPYLRGQPPRGQARYLYCESMHGTKYGMNALLGLDGKRWKFIQTTKPELYHLADDIHETLNVAGENPETVQGLRMELQGHLDDLDCQIGDSNLEVLDPADLDRLRQLGYTGESVTVSFDFDEGKPDPKDYISVLTQIESLDFNIDRGERDKAKTTCLELIEAGVELAFVHAKLGQIAILQGSDPDAIGHYLNALDLEPNNADWHNNLGVLMIRAGQLREAIGWLEEAVRLNPDHPKALESLEKLKRQLGEP